MEFAAKKHAAAQAIYPVAPQKCKFDSLLPAEGLLIVYKEDLL